MLILVLRRLALAGIILTLVLLSIKCSKDLKTEEGRENLSNGKKYGIYNAIVAFIANFLDVQGVGTHAVNTVAFKIGKSVTDSNIPGTLNVGATIPCCLAAYLFYPHANTSGVTLVSMIIAAIAGSFLGSLVVGKINSLGVKFLMGIGLIILSVFMIIRGLHIGNVDFESQAVSLTGFKLVIGIICSFIFGILMNVGVGYYAPCLAVCSLLGLNLAASMAIMFGASSMLMAFGNAPQLIKSGKFDIVATACQIIFGSIGVAVAYFVVVSLPITIISLVVAVAVLGTGILFLMDYVKSLKAINS